MADERGHFSIPTSDARTDKARVKGFGRTYPRESFASHGEGLVRQYQQLREARQRQRDTTYLSSAYVEVTTPADVAIRGEKGKLQQVGLELIAVSPRMSNRGTARVLNERFDELETRLVRYATEESHPYRSSLSVIESVGIPSVEDRIVEEIARASDGPIDCVLHLLVGLGERERAAVVLALRNFLSEATEQIGDATFLENGATALEARLTREQVVQAVGEFSTVRLVSLNRVFFVTDSTPFYPVNASCSVRTPTCSVAVAVLDGGINSSCAALAGVVQATVPCLPPGSVAPLGDHGSFVASRVVYGDDLETQMLSGTLEPICPVIDVPIFGKDAAGRVLSYTEPQLAAAIEQVVALLPHNARVLNLSLGSNFAIRDHEFSLPAQALDHQARKHDLIPVVSAGNIRPPALIASYLQNVAHPDWRLDPPAESLLAITVGSVARYVDTGALAQSGELSPFSRRGPGADGGIKPELVAHGGNCVANGRPTSRVAAQGLHPNGRDVAWDVGTSFAAPVVAGAAAKLCDHYGVPRANLIKALLFHFARRAVAPNVGIEACHLTGFGEPNVAAAVSAGQHSAAFLFSGRCRAGMYQYIPFIIPGAFAADAEAKLRIRVTLVFDPPVNPNNPSEYSQSRMAVLLRKAVQLGYREVSVSGDMYAGSPWNPVLHFEKSFSRGYVGGVWELRTRLWTRELPDDFEQEFAAVIEIQDDAGRIDVWTEIDRASNGRYRAGSGSSTELSA